ncbi:hypothetical protein BASA81_015322 [Batrachochytrium salamandrivorans]|nr:hypothetical protein BASA81_015322 [Batrachochytrium salamandrivorans]
MKRWSVLHLPGEEKPTPLSVLSLLLSLMNPGAKLVADLLRGSSLETVARTSKYSSTGVLHYADSDDDPPSSCSYDDNHSCADGKCLVGAVGHLHRCSQLRKLSISC